MLMARFSGGDELGHHRKRAQSHDSGLLVQTRFGSGISPTCTPPPFGAWLYLYLVSEVCNRMVVSWDVLDREDSAIAADLVTLSCLSERISSGRKEPLNLYCDNGNIMRATMLEVLGVLRLSSRRRLFNYNPCPE